jgi:Leucine-rich repeat (LRR) protein
MDRRTWGETGLWDEAVTHRLSEQQSRRLTRLGPGIQPMHSTTRTAVTSLPEAAETRGAVPLRWRGFWPVALLLLILPGAHGGKTEDDALHTVQKIGAFITRDEQAPGRPVVGVEFYGEHLNSRALTPLKQFPHLQLLGLTRWFPNESDFKDLAKLRELRSLKIGYTSFTRPDLKSLATLKGLRLLDLSQSDFFRARGFGPLAGAKSEDRSAFVVGSGFVDLKELAALPRLESLKLDVTHFADENVKELAPFLKLRELSLESNYATLGASLARLAALRQLRRLNLSTNYLTRPGTKALGKLPSLESLILRHTELGGGGPGDQTPPHEPWPDGLVDLATLRNLRALDLGSNSGVTDQGLKALVPLTQLQTLSLRSTPITDAGIAALLPFQRLKHLDLSTTAISDRGVAKLIALGGIDSLDLSYTKVTDAGIQKLVALKGLRSLNLSGTAVTDRALGNVAVMQPLESLSLINTQTTEAGLKKLGALGQLKTLELANTKASDAVLKELRRLKNLEVLDLSGTPITDAGLKALAGLKRLQTLRLDYTAITDAGIKELAALSGLERLELENCRAVSDASVSHLARLEHLNYLDVMMTRVSPAARDQLREVLPGLNINP